MEQVLISSAKVVNFSEYGSKNVELTGEINGEEFNLTVQNGNDGEWSIPTHEIGSSNDSAIKIGYKYFTPGGCVPSDVDELSACEMVEKIPEFCRQMIAAATTANAMSC